MISIAQILTAKPTQSSEIIEKLINENQISSQAARQRLSRTKLPVKRVKNINLPNREKIFYLQEHFGISLYFDTVEKILIKNRTAAGRSLIALKSKGGLIPLSLFEKASGTTINSMKGHICFKDALEQLKSNNLIKIVTDHHYDKLVCRYDRDEFSNRERAALEVENVTLSIIRSWLSNLGMSSLNVIKIREAETPPYGPFRWDLVCPSYLSGLVKNVKNSVQNGFIVGDIILDKFITDEDIIPFLYKFDSLINQRKIRPFIALFIADFFSKEALMELRKRGVIIARPENIFGKDFQELLKQLISTIENATEILKTNPDSVFELFKKLNKIEGASYNLRSVILDFIMARLYSLEGYETDIRKKLRLKNSERFEIDVISLRKDRIVLVENKALAPGNKLGKKEIESWINKSYNKINRWFKEEKDIPKNKSIEFCTSTEFHSDANEFISEISNNYKKIPIKFTSGTEIMNRLRKFNENSLVEIFREHFL